VSGVEGAQREDHDERQAGVRRLRTSVGSDEADLRRISVKKGSLTISSREDSRTGELEIGILRLPSAFSFALQGQDIFALVNPRLALSAASYAASRASARRLTPGWLPVK
jgi:hypothetical protein